MRCPTVPTKANANGALFANHRHHHGQTRARTGRAAMEHSIGRPRWRRMDLEVWPSPSARCVAVVVVVSGAARRPRGAAHELHAPPLAHSYTQATLAAGRLRKPSPVRQAPRGAKRRRANCQRLADTLAVAVGRARVIHLARRCSGQRARDWHWRGGGGCSSELQIRGRCSRPRAAPARPPASCSSLPFQLALFGCFQAM